MYGYPGNIGSSCMHIGYLWCVYIDLSDHCVLLSERGHGDRCDCSTPWGGGERAFAGEYAVCISSDGGTTREYASAGAFAE